MIRLFAAAQLGQWEAAGSMARQSEPFMQYGKGTASWKIHHLYQPMALLRSQPNPTPQTLKKVAAHH